MSNFEYGLDGLVLGWFKSYLTDRLICIHYNGQWSDFGNHSHPLWCAARISPWSSNFHPLRGGCHQHSESTWVQSTLVCRRSANLRSLAAIFMHQSGGPDVNLHRRNQRIDGHQSSKIKSDRDETNLARISSAVKTLGLVGELQIAGVGLKPTTHVCDLSVMIDNDLLLQCQVNHITRTCFYHLSQLRVIRRSLTVDTAHSLVRALVHSRLDYCNGVLAGMDQYQYDRLQSVLRAAARLVLRLPKWASISEAMRNKFHWLPYPERVEFKLCSTIYKCLHNSAPQYLIELCIPVVTLPGTLSSAISCIRRPLRTGDVY